MTEGKKNKSDPGPDFSRSPEIPPGTKSWLAGLLSQAKDSVLWNVTPVAGNSIARGLAHRGTIAVRVHAGHDFATREPLVYPATLKRQRAPDGSDEFTLQFDQRPPSEFHPYALCVGQLNLWLFEPVSLGKLPVATLKPSERDRQENAGLAAGLAAAAATDSEPLTASNERLALHWSDGQLEIRLDRPPRCHGQPVVVETHVEDVWGELQTAREVVSVEHRITDGPLAGYVMGTIACSEPAHVDLKRLRINVRPLRENDLPWLHAEQVDSLLAGQELRVLNTLVEGFELRAAARWDDQKQATSDPQASWLLRVATGKGVR